MSYIGARDGVSICDAFNGDLFEMCGHSVYGKSFALEEAGILVRADIEMVGYEKDEFLGILPEKGKEHRYYLELVMENTVTE